MRTPSPLPHELRSGIFSRRRALGLGVPPGRLKARDIVATGRGFYMWRGGAESEQPVGPSRPDDVGSLPPKHRLSTESVQLLRALQAEYTDSWLSHGTAAQLFGLQLPRRLDESAEIHFSRPRISTTTRRHQHLVSHAVVAQPGEVVEVAGLRTSRPGRIFFDLMAMLPEEELVALGDQLVRVPTFAFDGRSRAWETPSSLAGILRSHRKTKGIVKGRRAAEQVRVGADSRMETLARLALCEAGLPEPQLQVRPRAGSPFTGDLGYEEFKVVIQYDGGQHFSAEQQAKDQRRNFAFESAGWVVILVNAEDYRDGFRHLVQRVRHALAQRSGGLALEFWSESGQKWV